MPNTREKLIKLLKSNPYANTPYSIADHLISNGVTVQQWIPVTERLPDRWQNVLSVSKYGKHCVDCVFTYGSWWSGGEVTHWMPLPEPPKGE